MKKFAAFVFLFSAFVVPLSLKAQTTVFRDFTPSDTSGANIVGSNPIVGGTWQGTAGGQLLQYGANSGGTPEATPYSMYTNGAGRSIFSAFTSTLGAGQQITVSFNLLGFGTNFPNSNGYAGVSLYTGFLSADGNGNAQVSAGGGEREFIGEPNDNNSIGLDQAGTGHQTSGNTTVNVLASFTYAYDTGAWTFTTTGGVNMSGIGTPNLAFNALQVHNGSGGDFDLNNLSVVIGPVPAKGQTVFLDTFSENPGTAIVGQPADIGGTWTDNNGSANGLTVGPAHSLNTQGNGRAVFNALTSTLGPGEILTLSYDTVNDGNTPPLNNGFAGVSLYSGFVNGNNPGAEKIFTGNPSASAWGVDGVIGRNVGSDNALVNHLNFTYNYDSGAWTFTSNGFSASGTGPSNLPLNGLRVANGNGADIDVDNVTVNISPVPVVTRGAQPSVATIYSFPSGPNLTGDAPAAPLVVGTDGNFYGTTQYDGSFGSGTVFKLTPGGTVTPLYSFGAFPLDGVNPVAGLVQGANSGDGSLNFYGTTQFGGNGDSGTVFVITISPAGNVSEKVLHSFSTTGNDGLNPSSALIFGGDGKLYGTTLLGGSSNMGAVFQISTAGAETVFYSFGSNANDGATPYASLVLASDGNFYGTTQYGGAHNNGSVYQLTSAGVETAVYSFGSFAGDGLNPRGSLVALSSGGTLSLYGTTQFGGTANQGTVFSVVASPGSLTESLLHSFDVVSPDGTYPVSGLVLGGDGNLYGTTQYGGDLSGGTVFGITTTGTETLPYSLGTNANDAVYPLASLVLGNDGNLYGTSSSGGAKSNGAIFKVLLTSPVILPPVANDFAIVLTNGSPLTIDVVAQGSDSDPNSPALPITLTAVTPATLGTVTISGANTLLYTPYRNFLKYSGTDTFSYTISNGSATSTATVTVANPYYLQKGSYAGLVTAPDGSQGYLTLSLAGGGAFTGKLRTASGAFNLKGQFDANGTYSATVGGQTFTLSVNIADVGGASGSGDGSFTIAGSWADNGFMVGHALYNATSNPAPQAGVYTVLLPAAIPADAAVPYGTGYATLTVKETGAVKLAGKLADGTVFSDGVFITGGVDGNQFGVMVVLPYKPLNSGDQPGALTGAITFEEVSGVSDCDGVLNWSKPQTKPGLYADGFQTTVSTIGSLYTPPPIGKLAMVLPTALPNAQVSLADLDFSNTLTDLVNVKLGTSNNDTVTFQSGNVASLTMAINSHTGLFTGSFLNPASGKSVKLYGALFSKQDIAGGYFVTLTQSGAVSMVPYFTAAP